MKRNRLDQLKFDNEVVNHSNPVFKDEVSWLISVVEYYEMKIKTLYEVEKSLENGELDGFDYSEKMSEVVNDIHLRNY